MVAMPTAPGLAEPTPSDGDDHHDLHHYHHHSHPHGAEVPAGPSEAGTVVLDIGPGMGAAVILTPAHMVGLEIEYRAAGDAWQEKHMAVRERHGAGTVQYAAIFGPLPEGPYEFRVRGSRNELSAVVLHVTEASVNRQDWPGFAG
jgi:hypothetical protein